MLFLKNIKVLLSRQSPEGCLQGASTKIRFKILMLKITTDDMLTVISSLRSLAIIENVSLLKITVKVLPRVRSVWLKKNTYLRTSFPIQSPSPYSAALVCRYSILYLVLIKFVVQTLLLSCLVHFSLKNSSFQYKI